MGHVCPWWLAHTFDNPLRRLFHRPERIFAGLVAGGQVVADIGCGMGYFSIALARIVGSKGKVYAVDIQPRMLAVLQRRAVKAGVAEIVVAKRADGNGLHLEEPIDFALAFWMVHEIEDRHRFFQEIHAGLKTGGALLLAEPRFHVDRRTVAREAAIAADCGFVFWNKPDIALSHAILFQKSTVAPPGGSPPPVDLVGDFNDPATE